VLRVLAVPGQKQERTVDEMEKQKDLKYGDTISEERVTLTFSLGHEEAVLMIVLHDILVKYESREQLLFSSCENYETLLEHIIYFARDVKQHHDDVGEHMWIFLRIAAKFRELMGTEDFRERFWREILEEEAADG